jgi:hypothetical protein
MKTAIKAPIGLPALDTAGVTAAASFGGVFAAPPPPNTPKHTNSSHGTLGSFESTDVSSMRGLDGTETAVNHRPTPAVAKPTVTEVVAEVIARMMPLFSADVPGKRTKRNSTRIALVANFEVK